jgi:endonuclease/exonuclease/phosphatase family metal-dependent hydrolase
MTVILSWNIQNGRGVDGAVSLARIAEVIRATGKPDVICLQEVSRGLELPGAGRPDQPAELAGLFPDYEMIFGVAVDADPDCAGRRWQFGNALLSKLPVLSVQNHPLPRPAVAGVRHMARQAIKVTVAAPAGLARVINTHLEFHSADQRIAQIARLRDLQEEAISQMRKRPLTDIDGPYREIPFSDSCVMCGDFNLEVGSAEYARMLAPLAAGTQVIADAWPIARPDAPHDPTCGIHDRKQWPQGPHCRDFFFVTGAIREAVRKVSVDVDTDASDHQPLTLEISDNAL